MKSQRKGKILGFVFSIIAIIVGKTTSNDFKEMVDQLSKNPTFEAAERTGYGMDSIQPYYVCDSAYKDSAIPLSAWHYSCKQSCSDKQTKSHINITRTTWKYIGSDVDTYKISTNKVCYTSHENIWGYCTQSQTITPVNTDASDREKIPIGILDGSSGLKGVKTIINSREAPCEYMSDNTRCARDYVVTYRPGKISKRSETEARVLNIYGDGIRTDPSTGQLIQNEVAWLWDPKKTEENPGECGWYLSGDATCKFTETSEVMYCPDIGYQYVIKDLNKIKTCKGEIYDIDGPAPFLFLSKEQQKARGEVASKAAEGKGEPEINLIKGINTALTSIEESYCSSSCDLFSRGGAQDDNTVLDTPIGTWRLINATTSIPKLSPCYPTVTWRMKSPTHICHGKNHVLVEDSKTKHTCSWDTTKDYIVVDDVCNSDSDEVKEDYDKFRQDMSNNKDITIDFWTGDRIKMSPPYSMPIWEKFTTNVTRNPGWFSKVELNKGMLHNKEDISHILTRLMEDTKQEISYSPTADRTIKSLLMGEIVTGLGTVAGNTMSTVMSILGGVPKFLIMLVIIIVVLWTVKMLVEVWLAKRTTSAVNKNVHFSGQHDGEQGHFLMSDMAGFPSKKVRSRSRSRQLASLVGEI